MKKLTIWRREVRTRTIWTKFRFKTVVQYVIFYDGAEYTNSHCEKIDNPRLKVPFTKIFESRSKKDLEVFISSLGRTDAEKWLKSAIYLWVIGEF